MTDPTSSSDARARLGDAAEPLSAPAEIVVEAPPRWERLLEAAGGTGAPTPPSKSPAARGPISDPAAVALPWIRALVPLLLVMVYVGYKIAQTPPPEPRRPDIEVARSLTNVSRKTGTHRMDRETAALVDALNLRVQGRNWAGILNAVADAKPEIREHPGVKAYEAIARVETGESSPDLIALLIVLEREFEGDADRKDLVEYLRLARGIAMFRTEGNTANSLMRMTTEIRPMLASLAVTPRVVEFRIMLAERFERFARDEEAAGTGTFTNDELHLAAARQLYQQGLRWVVTREGWLKAQPIAPGKPSVVAERLLLSIRKVNAKLNGWAVPMTESDSSTWTGRRGDPVHDAPGGVW